MRTTDQTPAKTNLRSAYLDPGAKRSGAQRGAARTQAMFQTPEKAMFIDASAQA